MNGKYQIGFICSLSVLLLTSCWNKQSHETNGPELPNYSVSGTVFESVQGEPLAGATVSVDDQQTVTDSLGRYTISHVSGGEGHTLVIQKNGYEEHASSFLMGYADLDSFDFILGKLLYVAKHTKGPSPEPNGLVWTGDISWASCGFRKRIYVLDERRGLEEVKYFDSPGSFPPKESYTTPYGLTATEEAGEWYLWVSVAFDEGDAYVYKMAINSDTTLSAESRYDTPESEYGSNVDVTLDDLTYDGKCIWSCSSRERKIYKHGPDMSELERFFFIDDRPVGIAWDGSILWMITSSSNRLYMLNPVNLGPAGYYIINEAPLAGLFYRDGYVWVCKHGSQHTSSYFYAYRID